MEGEPVLLTKEQLQTKRREMGPYVFGCQMMQDLALMMCRDSRRMDQQMGPA